VRWNVVVAVLCTLAWLVLMTGWWVWPAIRARLTRRHRHRQTLDTLTRDIEDYLNAVREEARKHGGGSGG
jgi:hypothetical protein